MGVVFALSNIGVTLRRWMAGESVRRKTETQQTAKLKKPTLVPTMCADKTQDDAWITELDQQKLGIAGKIAAGKSTFLKNTNTFLARKSITPIVEEERVEMPLLQAYIDSVTAATAADALVKETGSNISSERAAALRNAAALEGAAATVVPRKGEDAELLQAYVDSVIAANAAHRRAEQMASNFQTERAVSCHHRQEIVMTKREAFKNPHVALVERPLYENLCFALANERCGNLPKDYDENLYVLHALIP
jgi:energy-coupling factor transporter ATP-binding protein EcfA2